MLSIAFMISFLLLHILMKVQSCILLNLFLHQNHMMTAALSYIYHLLGLATIVPFVFQNLTTSSYSWVFISPNKLESHWYCDWYDIEL